MAATPKTTRDQLTLLVHLLQRALRHTWLVALIVIVGAGLSIVFATSQKPQYDSETVLLYQEKISQSVLTGRDVASNARSVSTRFREMLLSRQTLSKVVEEFDLYPDVVEQQGTIAAAEKLALRINFSDRGAGTYRISFRGDSPEEAQQVTARMASLLQAQHETIRRDQAQQTQKFLEAESAQAEVALLKAEEEFAAFVTKHPEFVAETTAGAQSTVGAGIRAATTKKQPTSDSSRLSALQRQARRLKESIENPAITPVAPPRPRVESPALRRAREDLLDAKRHFDEKSARFTAKHPDVIAAKNGVAEAERRLKRAVAAEKASTPKTTTPTVSPTASVADKQKALAKIEAEIARLKANNSSDSENKEVDELATALVDLETEHARLQRKVEGARQRLSTLESRVFTAEITASSEFAEAAQLVIIDKAYLPSRPAGKGRKILVIAGTLVFGLLGCGIALGLALIDDRIYRRQDIDELGIAPVLVTIPKVKKAKRKAKRG